MSLLAELPRLRADLVVRAAPDGEAGWIVKDPASGRFFRWGEPERFVASQLDGATPPDEVHRRLETHLRCTAAPGDVQALVASLGRAGLLDDGRRRPPPPRLGGGLLDVRLRAFEPQRLLGWLEPRARACFSPGFAWAAGAVVALGAWLLVLHRADLAADVAALLRPEVLPLAWLVSFAVTIVHELGHGVACWHFGGRPREMGVLLIYFQLALFCNVSDAWLMPRRQRALVSIAGPIVEVVVWGLAAVAWRLAEPGSPPAVVALVVVATSGVKTLLNLNPLIKLDGYYFMSDLLGIPNLRRRAFEHVRWLAGLGPRATDDAKEGRALLLYGLLAGTYSVALVAAIVATFGGWLVGEYRAAGLLALVLLLAVLLRRTLAAAGRALLDPAAWRGLAKLAAAGALVAAILSLLAAPGAVSRRVHLRPAARADVRAPFAGLVDAVLVAEGDAVAVGQPLLRLDGTELEAELRQVEAELLEARARQALLAAGPRREAVELGRALVAGAERRARSARAVLEQAQAEHAARLAGGRAAVRRADERLAAARAAEARVADVVAQGVATRRELADARAEAAVCAAESAQARAELAGREADALAPERAAVEAAEAEHAQREAEVRLLEAGSRPEEVQALEAVAARLEARRELVRARLARRVLVSPVAGVVATARLQDALGRHVAAGELVAEVHDPTVLEAEVTVSEGEARDLALGQRVVLRTGARLEDEWSGSVVLVAPAAETDALGRNVVRVLARVRNDPPGLLPGASGVARICTGPRSLLDAWARDVRGWIRMDLWALW